MTITRFSDLYCSGNIVYDHSNTSKYDVFVKGIIHDVIKDGKLYYIAANPIERRTSFSGSGFPFANKSQAFENTPTKGMLNVTNNNFQIPLLFPNSFHTNLGNDLIPPSLFLKWTSINGDERVVSIKLSDPIPYRFIEYPKHFTMARNGATFYHAHHNLPVRTQEQIFIDGVYPHKNKMSEDYWGLRPAL